MVEFEKNQKLVEKVIWDRFRGVREDLVDDLRQEGLIGLWEACQKYKEGIGEFSTYGYWRIYYRMLNFLKKEREWDCNICYETEESLEYFGKEMYLKDECVPEKKVGYDMLKEALVEECKESSKRRIDILNEFIDGKRITDIARKFNISKQRVNYVLQAHFRDFKKKYECKNGEIHKKKVKKVLTKVIPYVIIPKVKGNEK